jgi:hypothetical protein
MRNVVVNSLLCCDGGGAAEFHKFGGAARRAEPRRRSRHDDPESRARERQAANRVPATGQTSTSRCPPQRVLILLLHVLAVNPLVQGFCVILERLLLLLYEQ